MSALSVDSEDGAQSDGYVVDAAVVAKVQVLASQSEHGSAHVRRWQRALAGLGALDPGAVTGGAMTAAQARQMADAHSSPVWDEVVAELTALEAAAVQTPPPPPVPVVSVTAAAGGAEGDPVTFTVSASPAPAAGLPVAVTVAASGDFGYGPLPASVTIPASGSVTVTIATADDDTDEPDGQVTLTVNAAGGYTVGTPSTETVTVADDDDPAQAQTGYAVDPAVVAKVEVLASQTQHGAAHVRRWQRALAGLGALDPAAVIGGAMTAAEARQMADAHSSPVWDEVAAELTAVEAAPQQT
ncbi:MAG: hypothetical protein OXN79_13510, partial [bacterium]|nr:hypothetical protein [bacterium]